MSSNYDYHQFLKFLYFEGYADSYEEAEYLLEEINDDEFDELYEEYLSERSFFGKQPGRAIQTTGARRSSGSASLDSPDLEAMKKRFKQEDEEEAAAKAAKNTKPSTTVPSRGIGANEPLLRRRTPEGHSRRGSSPFTKAKNRARVLSTGRNPNARAGEYAGSPTDKSKALAKKIRAALKKSEKWGTPEANAEEYVLEYLIQEGYTNSYESALRILGQMSENWLIQILND